MTDDPAYPNRLHLTENWQVWAALHHFLPARALRELLEVIVEEVSQGTFRFEQLFDDTMTGAPDVMSSWLVRPLEAPSPLAIYLQNRVRGLIWQNDTPCHFEVGKDDPPGNARPAILEAAVELGTLDFGNLGRASEQVQKHSESSHMQRSLILFIAALNSAASSTALLTDDAFIAALSPALDGLPSPVDALAAKHLGDLFADGDTWGTAYRCYDQAQRRLPSGLDHWANLSSWLSPIVSQSQAAALNHMQGPAVAAKFLSDLLGSASTLNSTQTLANASLDMRALRFQSSDTASWTADTQPALLLPPLLLDAQDVASPLRSWLNGKSNSRLFWAVLRRQIALGSTINAQITKAYYARSIVDRLDRDNSHQVSRESFDLAVRLLIESADARAAAETRWPPLLVHVHVDEDCVTSAIQHARHYHASSEARLHVLLEVFQAWIVLLSPGKGAVARVMLKLMAATAHTGRTSLRDTHNLGGASLEALSSVAAKRPEWREFVSADVATAVLAKLGSPEFWTAKTAALEVALAFADAFSENELREVINRTLALTEEIKPEAQNWTVVRPALSFLVSPPVRRAAALVPSLGNQIIATILRFGIHDPTAQTGVMFYLHNFDAALLKNQSVAAALHDTVIKLRRSAGQINSSMVTDNIAALLLSPVISRREGVKDAIDALLAVLRSALERTSPSMGLSSAYQPLIQLANDHSQIAHDLDMELSDFRAWLEPLLTVIVEIWTRATERPGIFSTFSLPPNPRPNSIIVHNWAFASLAFAESLGNSGEVRQALKTAETQPLLAEAVALGRATRSVTEIPDDFEPAAILSETGVIFYDALGRRIALLQLLSLDRARALCKVLITQCFSHGPRAVDAAVLYAAARFQLGDHVRQCKSSNYTKKLENDRDVRLAVEPILATFNEDRGKIVAAGE